MVENTPLTRFELLPIINETMKNPGIKTRVVHSQSKAAWNIVGVQLGRKYKVARVPYIVTDIPAIDKRERQEAFEQAEFISYCFNNADRILQ